ncbi:MAG: antitoxin VapB [Sphingomonadales bacterium]|jgi:antitoxin VapB|nr:antitoxin VapB [Sphingomonadales bacterium]
MSAGRHVKLFRNGRNQAVRIPREFELPGKDAVMRKEGERLIIEPEDRKKSLREVLEWLRSQPPLGPEDWFPEIDDPPPEPVDLFGDEEDG